MNLLASLHAQTLYITVTVVMFSAASLLTWVGFTQRTYRGFWWWVWAQWLNLGSAACLLLVDTHPIMLALSVVLAMQWPITMLTGLRSFYVRSEMIAPAWVDRLVLASAFLLWSGTRLLLPDDVAARVAAFSIGSMACYAYSAAMVLSMPDHRRSANIRAMAFFLMLAVPMQLPRLVDAWNAWGDPAAHASFTATQPALVLALMVGVLLAVYMGLMLTYERTEHDLRESQRQLRLMVELDMLTQLPNRVHFMESARQSIRLSRPGSCTLLVFDIDHFRRINEQHGHAAGDTALRLVSGVARNMLRGRDLIGRLGGDQFVCLLPETPEADAFRVAERMTRLVLDKQQTTEGREPVRLSFGIVQMQDNEGLDHSIHRASEALAEAKRRGRGCAVSTRPHDTQGFEVVHVQPLATAAG